MSDVAPEDSEVVPGVLYRDLVEAARPHRTETSFRDSPLFRAHGAALERLLLTPRVEPPAGGPTTPEGPENRSDPGPAGWRVLQWNIEKGREIEGIIRRLREDPWMRGADVFLLNEVDCGTARGGNLDQARRIAEALGMHHAWLPTYIELTKGTGPDLEAAGENSLGLHGLAILSRWPIVHATAVALPACHDYFRFHEKRLGGRRGLYALIAAPGRPFVAATTHLEVRRTPRCRARQFAAFLGGLDASMATWGCDRRSTPVVLAGDWNTNTFRRGNIVRSAREFLRLVTTPAAGLDLQLRQPFSREPLFSLLDAHEFVVSPCNEAIPTAEQALGSAEDLTILPAPVVWAIERVFHVSRRVLRMRLDWIAVRGPWKPARPVTLPAVGPDGRALSDHAAIGVDLVWS